MWKFNLFLFQILTFLLITFPNSSFSGREQNILEKDYSMLNKTGNESVCLILPNCENSKTPSFIEKDSTGSVELTKIYLKGLEKLKNSDTVSATTLFSESIRIYSDSPSYFKLGEIYSKITNIDKKLTARKYFREAIEKEPDNLIYRFQLAVLLEELARLEPTDIFSREEAIAEYRKIIEYDSLHFNANMRLGDLRKEDFAEYNNSFIKSAQTPQLFYSDHSSRKYIRFQYEKFIDEITPKLSYQNVVCEFLAEAESCFKRAIKKNPISKDARKKLCFLLMDSGYPEKGIPILLDISEKDMNKDIHLYLGLLYYKSMDFENAHKEYQKAIEMMQPEEYVDFTFNSVKKIIEPILGEECEKMTDEQMKKYIESYWNAKDPLKLTEYNERLLEHYSRIAYANLRFGVPNMNITGWKTDMGEMMARYGEPLSKTTFRPFIGDYDIYAKTEVWNYNDFTLAFADPFQNGKMIFSTPNEVGQKSQYSGDTQLLVEGGLRKTKPEEYTPKFDGPIFDVPYYSTQFKSVQGDMTDVYINYGIKINDSLLVEDRINQSYNVGLFYWDENFNEKFGRIEKIERLELNNESFSVHTISMTTEPDSGNLAFEMIREKDKGVASYHGKFQIRDFSDTELQISDILLASDISISKDSYFPLKRGDYEILPNPEMIYSNNSPLYIYYEIYNLKKDSNRITDFEQEITIQKKDSEGNILNELLSFVGLDSSGKEVQLKSRYQTLESNPKLYLQIDLSDNEPGEYVIILKIKDNISGISVKNSTSIKWM